MPPDRLRVLTWHVHSAYLWSLSHIEHEIFLPVGPNDETGYGGRTDAYPWPDNLHEVPGDSVRQLDLDAIVFQSRQNWFEDQHRILTDEQRRLPRLYLEHDPPREHPTDTRHPVDDPRVLLVHCTPFNALMWDSGRTPWVVVDHGIPPRPDVRYSGELPRGITVVNGMPWRGRRLGADLFAAARERVPLDLVGMQSEELGGLGEMAPMDVAAFGSRYRFFYHPVRWTSLGLAVLEAMSIGMPIVGLATTELGTVVEDGVSGFVSTDPEQLIDRMRLLLDDPALARRLGDNARRVAQERFGIERFAHNWDTALHRAIEIAADVPERSMAVAS